LGSVTSDLRLASLPRSSTRADKGAGEPIAEDAEPLAGQAGREDLFGTAVIEAARIAAAQGGEILVANAVVWFVLAMGWSAFGHRQAETGKCGLTPGIHCAIKCPLRRAEFFREVP